MSTCNTETPLQSSKTKTLAGLSRQVVTAIIVGSSKLTRNRKFASAFVAGRCAEIVPRQLLCSSKPLPHFARIWL